MAAKEPRRLKRGKSKASFWCLQFIIESDSSAAFAWCRGGLNGSAPMIGLTYAQLKPSVWQSEFFDGSVSTAVPFVSFPRISSSSRVRISGGVFLTVFFVR